MNVTKLAAAITGAALLTACGAETSDTETVAGPEAFCEQLTTFEQLPPPETGGNNAEQLTTLLAVAEDSIADELETVRDYHLDGYVAGDPDTDTFDSFPPEVQEAVERLDIYAEENCEGFRN